MKTTLKPPANNAVSQMAAIIVSKEVSRLLGPEGALKLMKIAALLKMIHPLYQFYYDAVDQGSIQLETVKHYFGAEAWAKMSTPKRKLLAVGIVKEVESVKQQVYTHMLYLHKNDAELATLSPSGQAALELVMRELTGEMPATETAMTAEKGGMAA